MEQQYGGTFVVSKRRMLPSLSVSTLGTAWGNEIIMRTGPLMLKLFSWNVNGLRAIFKKGFLDWLTTVQPDILGILETKSRPDDLPDDLRHPSGYETYWASAKRLGYSGVGLYTRLKPKSVQIGIGIPEFDQEGRTLIADYGDFVLIVAYFPNSGADLSRLPYKLAYDEALLSFCKKLLDRGRSIICGGDFNVAHQEIDIAQPKQNQKHAGFLPEERGWMDKFISAGFVDTFRALHPDQKGAYTWWTYFANARERNLGWRLDYFFVSQDLMPRVVDAAIHPGVMGSDHCPISLTLK